MSSSPASASSWKQIAWTTAILGALVKCALALSGVLEGAFVADDAYYYFTIARHMAAGSGPTFDGLAPTNGFQPLWQLLLVPLYEAFDDLWRPVRAALLLTVLLDLLTAWRLFGIVRARAGGQRAYLAVALWSATPLGLLLGLRGMEASLSALTVVLVLEAATSDGGRGVSWRRALGLGALVGLSGLARTDNLLTVGAAVAACLWLWRDRREPPARALVALVCAASTAAVVMAPWFLWSWTRFGQLVQVSGQVKRLTDRIFGSLPAGWTSVPEAASTLAHALFAPVLVPVRRLGGQEFGTAHSWPWIGAAVLAGGGLVLALGLSRRTTSRSGAGPVLGFVMVYAVAHALLFGVVWRAYADWYAAPTYALLAAAFALLVDPLAQRGRAVRRLAWGGALTAGLGLAALAVSNVLLFPYQSRRPEQRWEPLFDRVVAVRPQGARLGAWDAGMAGYVATGYAHLTVVNLDGLVNNQAFEAVQRGDYLGYLLRTVDIYLQDPARARIYLDSTQVRLLQSKVGGPLP